MNPVNLIMDCTYKTNKFKLPLFMMCGIISMNTTFYVAFSFQLQEEEADYWFSFTELQNLYVNLDLPDFKIIITDTDSALMNAISIVFTQTANFLCLWHINKNILTYLKQETTLNAREYLDADGKITSKISEAMKHWYGILYTSDEDDYNLKWNLFKADYAAHQGLLHYLKSTWLKHDCKIMCCFTNCHCHWGNTSTSRGKGSHWGLKSTLQGSTGNLDYVVDQIDLKVMNQTKNYHNKVAAAQQQLPCNLLKGLYREVLALITPYTLNKIAKQEEFLSKPYVPCTIHYIKAMGLPCSHIIRRQLTESGCLKLEDFDPHWQFDASPQSCLPFIHINDIDIDSLLQVADPPMARPRGRPRGALNQNWRT